VGSQNSPRINPASDRISGDPFRKNKRTFASGIFSGPGVVGRVIPRCCFDWFAATGNLPHHATLAGQSNRRGLPETMDFGVGDSRAVKLHPADFSPPGPAFA